MYILSLWFPSLSHDADRSRSQISFKKRAPRAVRVVRQFASKVMLTQAMDDVWSVRYVEVP